MVGCGVALASGVSGAVVASGVGVAASTGMARAWLIVHTAATSPISPIAATTTR